MGVPRNSPNAWPRGTLIAQLIGYPVGQWNILRVIARVVVGGARPLRLLLVVVMPLPPGDVRKFFMYRVVVAYGINEHLIIIATRTLL